MPAHRCPICHKSAAPVVDNPVFPFCSERCKLLDLGHWLDGRYVVASSSPFDEEDRPERHEEPTPEH
jgi:endogenous inhibitor of DNA gyrase (YacG/DUF329 family)